MSNDKLHKKIDAAKSGDSGNVDHIKNTFAKDARPCSAPPVDKLFMSDDVELVDIQGYLQYSSYFRRNSKDDVRLPPPEFYIRGQNGIWLSEYDDIITKAFSSDIYSMKKDYKASLLDKIDKDYPESESSEYKGTSRATTPIGDQTIMDTEMFNTILNINKSSSDSSINTVKKRIMQEFENKNNLFLQDIFSFFNEQQRGDALKFKSLNSSSNCMREICVSMSKDQEGSRLIQNRIDISTDEEVFWFFDQIEDALFDLSSNLFGNYVIQKIVPYLNTTKKAAVLEEFRTRIYALSMHPYGCRVVQKIIESIDCLDFITEEIRDNVFHLIEDQNGNHVIQKYIEKSSNKDLIIEAFEKNAIYPSTHRYGCRVIQRLLEFCSREEVKKILRVLIGNLESLVNDQYGNYVIQHMLTVGEREEKDMVIQKIINDSYELSKYKFSSNVIEQCVVISRDDQKEGFLRKFLELEENKPRIYNMCVDMYGNYVVQRFYDSCTTEIKERIKKILKPYVKDLKKISFARHILYKINT